MAGAVHLSQRMERVHRRAAAHVQAVAAGSMAAAALAISDAGGAAAAVPCSCMLLVWTKRQCLCACWRCAGRHAAQTTRGMQRQGRGAAPCQLHVAAPGVPAPRHPSRPATTTAATWWVVCAYVEQAGPENEPLAKLLFDPRAVPYPEAPHLLRARGPSSCKPSRRAANI